jgi:hypothetical protein
VLFFVFVFPMRPSLAACKYCLLSALLVGLICAGMKERSPPEEFMLGSTVAGLALCWFIPVSNAPTQFLLVSSGRH